MATLKEISDMLDEYFAGSKEPCRCSFPRQVKVLMECVCYMTTALSFYTHNNKRRSDDWDDTWYIGKNTLKEVERKISELKIQGNELED